MSGSLNRVMLIGRLTRDPELTYTSSGTAICKLGIATSSYGSDKVTGERKEYTEFHNVVVWNQGARKLADLCGQYLAKGRLVYIEGKLQTSSWDDKDTGAKRYKTEVNAGDVQFLSSKSEDQGTAQPTGSPVGATAPAGVGAPVGAGAPAEGGDIDPDDIPF
jgi:single-strand DNA-binding protein